MPSSGRWSGETSQTSHDYVELRNRRKNAASGNSAGSGNAQEADSGNSSCSGNAQDAASGNSAGSGNAQYAASGNNAGSGFRAVYLQGRLLHTVGEHLQRQQSRLRSPRCTCRVDCCTPWGNTYSGNRAGSGLRAVPAGSTAAHRGGTPTVVCNQMCTLGCLQTEYAHGCTCTLSVNKGLSDTFVRRIVSKHLSTRN